MTKIDSRDLVSSFEVESWSRDVKIHATLMLLGWGFFIPVALFVNTHLYRHDDDDGYNDNSSNNSKIKKFRLHFHMSFSLIGLILALLGFVHSIPKFTTLTRTVHVDWYEKAHGIIGCVAMAGGLLQVLLMAFMRPFQTRNCEAATWPWWQKMGHFGHRGLGFLFFVLAVVVMEMGTHISDIPPLGLVGQNYKYSGALMGTLLAMAVTVVLTVRMVLQAYAPTNNTAIHASIRIPAIVNDDEEEAEAHETTPLSRSQNSNR